MAAKYKIGDKVIPKPYRENGKTNYPRLGFDPSMENFVGHVCTIINMIDEENDGIYLLKEDKDGFWWEEEALEPATKYKYQIGDIVVVDKFDELEYKFVGWLNSFNQYTGKTAKVLAVHKKHDIEYCTLEFTDYNKWNWPSDKMKLYDPEPVSSVEVKQKSKNKIKKLKIKPKHEVEDDITLLSDPKYDAGDTVTIKEFDEITDSTGEVWFARDYKDEIGKIYIIEDVDWNDNSYLIRRNGSEDEFWMPEEALTKLS